MCCTSPDCTACFNVFNSTLLKIVMNFFRGAAYQFQLCHWFYSLKKPINLSSYSQTCRGTLDDIVSSTSFSHEPSWYGNGFLSDCPLRGESTEDRWFPSQREVMESLNGCIVVSLNQLLDKHSSCRRFKTRVEVISSFVVIYDCRRTTLFHTRCCQRPRIQHYQSCGIWKYVTMY